MSHELREGVELTEIISRGDENYSIYRIGRVNASGREITRITVREQIGQIGMVPWALIEFNDRPSILFNLDAAESVEFSNQEEGR